MPSTTDDVVDLVGAGGVGRSFAMRLGMYGRRSRLWTRRARADIERQLNRDLESLARARPRCDTAGIAGLIEIHDGGEVSMADAWLVIEFVEESIVTKRSVLRTISDAVQPDTAIGTGTSTLCPSELAAYVDHPHRLFGIHPFSPVTLSSVIEFCRPQGADPGVVGSIAALLSSLDLHVVEVPDRPAYLFNRVFLNWMAGAINADETGERFADIDCLVRLGNHVPRGPFELMDLIGLDTILDCFQNLSRLGFPGYEAASTRLRMLVAEGRTGVGHGAGFYLYSLREDR